MRGRWVVRFLRQAQDRQDDGVKRKGEGEGKGKATARHPLRTFGPLRGSSTRGYSALVGRRGRDVVVLRAGWPAQEAKVMSDNQNCRLATRRIAGRGVAKGALVVADDN